MLVAPYGCPADFSRTRARLRRSPRCPHPAPLTTGRPAPQADWFVVAMATQGTPGSPRRMAQSSYCSRFTTRMIFCDLGLMPAS